MARSPQLILKGGKETVRKFKRLSNVQRLARLLRKPTTASAQVVVKGVRKFWPVDSGLSKKSVTKKIIKGRAGFTAIIGIDKDAIGAKPDGGVHIPANIDHLVELGFQHPNGQTVAAVAPLRRGFEASKAQSEAVFEQKAAAEFEKEALKR